MLKLSGHGGVCEHDICARWIVENSGISPEYWGVYAHDNIIDAWQQFFLTFQGKRQQGGRFIKCAEVRTKKVCRKCGTLQKVAQKRAVMCFGKFEKVRAKKEFCNTIYA